MYSNHLYNDVLTSGHLQHQSYENILQPREATYENSPASCGLYENVQESQAQVFL